MRAMVLERQGEPLRETEIPRPEPAEGQILVHVNACGVCRTDLHIRDGDLEPHRMPVVLGHQIAGRVERLGAGATRFSPGDRVGVVWLGGSCGQCRFCRAGLENLCDRALYTGYDRDGGYAEMCVADERFAFALPEGFGNVEVAPLLCAGLIGYRAYRMTQCPAPRNRDAERAGEGLEVSRIGFYGFGSSASILCQLAVHEGKKVYAFTRPGDDEGQEFARRLGAAWAGGSDTQPPETLDAAIIFAPVGALYLTALDAVRKGGVVVSAGIHMSDIPSFPYSRLWGERVMRSVANLTRSDGQGFLKIAAEVPVRTEVTTYPLKEADKALDDLSAGRFKGSAVLVVDEDVIG